MMQLQSAVPIQTLSNGIRVVFLPTSSPVAHLGVTVLGGSRYEKHAEIGLAHFLEHCIFKGTQKRKTFHVLSRIDSVGGELNAYTTKEEICVYASFVKEHLERSIELLADIILHSNFPQKEIEKEKEIVIDEINSYLDSPSDRIFDDFEKNLFQQHPLGENILGSSESVNSFTQQNLQQYLRRFFHAKNMVISVVGDFKSKKLFHLLEKHFLEVPNNQPIITPEKFISSSPFSIRSQESNFQSHGNIGGIAPGYDNEKERRALMLLTNVLGGPALNSRLTLAIREKYGYTYSIEANYTPFQEVGYWNIYFGCDQKYVDKTLKLVKKELKKVRENAFSTINLHRAKEQYKGQIALSMESNSGQMLGFGKSALIFNEIQSVQEVYQAIEEITSEDILSVANQYFEESKISQLIYLQKED